MARRLHGGYYLIQRRVSLLFDGARACAFCVSGGARPDSDNAYEELGSVGSFAVWRSGMWSEVSWASEAGCAEEGVWREDLMSIEGIMICRARRGSMLGIRDSDNA